MAKLFGTDGIRGPANEYPLTSEMAVAIGRAVVAMFAKTAAQPRIIIGRDTRLSGNMIEYALASGVCSAGAEAQLAGILPTPGVAYATAAAAAAAGIVISASHNPFYDNGIKIFDRDGYKLSDKKEAEIERLVLGNPRPVGHRMSRPVGCVRHLGDTALNYAAFLKALLPANAPFRGIKAVLDCANGATCRMAPDVFSELGAEVTAIFTNPDGRNINAGCGSEHPQSLIEQVVKTGADVGLAFDGDGDRLVAVDEKGQVFTGDRILAICAAALKKKGLLKNNLVVSTVMSNLGLGLALKQLGIEQKMAPVGDRYVLQAMLAAGAVLGGEDSGHMIFLDHHTTGDGILSGIKLLEAMQTAAKPLSELGDIMQVLPQELINVPVASKPDISEIPEIMAAIRSVEGRLAQKGRVLVRYSGTQPVCRVMVEGPGAEETRAYCRQIADIIKDTLGSG